MQSSGRQEEEEKVKIVEMEGGVRGDASLCCGGIDGSPIRAHVCCTVQQSRRSLMGITSHVRYLLL